MICNGIVSNVTNFGAFVDIGVHQDGLVHISEIANQFVNDPQKMLSPGDQVQVQVKAFDVEKSQISLTMKFGENAKPAPKSKKRASFKGDKKGKGGGKPKGKGGKGKGGSGGGKPRRPAQPFNNPFAALGELKKS